MSDFAEEFEEDVIMKQSQFNDLFQRHMDIT